jgi:UMF1 family MFS transporter
MLSSKKSIYGWLLYDWANSAFATTIMATVLPIYYSQVAAFSLSPNIASSYWGYTNTIATLLMVFFAPILGAIADYKRAKIKFLGSFIFLGIIFTFFLFFIRKNDWFLASILYIIAHTGFWGANIFYDSLLPFIAKRDDFDKISTLGYASGYLGGGVLLALNLAMISYPHLFYLANTEIAVRVCFITVAVWWGIFSIPILVYTKESKMDRRMPQKQNPVIASIKSIIGTLKRIKEHKQAFLFLLAFWLYNDGINTVIIMAAIFGSEIGIGTEHLIGAILAVQFIGVPFTILFGKLAEKIGTKKAIYLGLITYTLFSIAAYFIRTALHFWILAIVVAMVQGGTQALSRSMFALLIPKEKSAEFFGFFDVSQKFSVVLGPAIFGIMGQLTGSSRFGIVSLVIFFLGGMLLLTKVKAKIN